MVKLGSKRSDLGYYYAAGNISDYAHSDQYLVVMKMDAFGDLNEWIVIDIGDSLTVTGLDEWDEGVLVSGYYGATPGEPRAFAVFLDYDLADVYWARDYVPTGYLHSWFGSMETFIYEGEERAILGGTVLKDSTQVDFDYWIAHINPDGGIELSLVFEEPGVTWEAVNAVAWDSFSRTSAFSGTRLGASGYKQLVVGYRLPCGGVMGGHFLPNNPGDDYVEQMKVVDKKKYIIIGSKDNHSVSRGYDMMYTLYDGGDTSNIYHWFYGERGDIDDFAEGFATLDKGNLVIVGRTYNGLNPPQGAVIVVGPDGSPPTDFGQYEAGASDYFNSVSPSLLDDTSFFVTGNTLSYDLGTPFNPGWALSLDEFGNGAACIHWWVQVYDDDMEPDGVAFGMPVEQPFMEAREVEYTVFYEDFKKAPVCP